MASVLSVRADKCLLSVQDIITRLNEGSGPRNPAELLSMLTHRLNADRMSAIVSDLDDAVDAVEEKIIDTVAISQRSTLVSTRYEIILLRRYLSPQREAPARLLSETASWLGERDRLAIREAGDRVSRYLEDLDSCRDRAALSQEELASRIAEQYEITDVRAVDRRRPLSAPGLFNWPDRHQRRRNSFCRRPNGICRNQPDHCSSLLLLICHFSF